MTTPFDLGSLFTKVFSKGVSEWQDTINKRIRNSLLAVMTKCNEIITSIDDLTTDDISEGITNLYYTDARVRLNRIDQMAIPTAIINLNSQYLNYLGGIYSYGLTGTAHSTVLNFGSPSNLGSTAGSMIKNASFGAYTTSNAISLTTFTKRVVTDASGWNTSVFGLGYAVDNSLAPFGGILYFSQRNNLGGIGIDCDTPLARFHVTANEDIKAIFDGSHHLYSGINISNTHGTGSAFLGFGSSSTPTNSGYIEKYPIANPTYLGKMFVANDADISFLINGDFDLLKIQADKNVAVKNKLLLSASSTTRASINFIAGTAPTSPVDGDIWFDGTNLKIRVGGVTKTVTIS